MTDLTAVVPAGGAGTRLWPLSRRAEPKFLLDLTGTGRTLLQQTWDRLDGVAGRVCVVTGAAHAGAVARQLPGLDLDDLLAEPSPRDSAAAIGLAAAVVHARNPQAVVGSFAADHVIADASLFAAAVEEAVAVARTGRLVTIGITATRPATGFGYIRPGDPLGVVGAPSALAVDEFVEKPDAATAERYLKQGYRWNAGMFVARAAVLLELLDGYRPQLAAGLRAIGAAWDTPQRQQVLDEVWPTLEKVAIDYAVAEPAAAAGRVAVVPGEFGWDDVGDFGSLQSVLPDERLSVLGGGELLSVDASGLVVTSPGRVVALLGLQDVVVVDTPDAVLVAARSHVQQVKSIVDRLAAADRTDLL
ncbi:mannose-1-phosphate guanylyltransferase [Angustibacter sp. McL0619]|uniref:mannose-1-phosphate guanylyltransferase n=1 Tax=Angustibacter sp. McL0619 TaxID=3415676 RepID=UPI003CF45E3A